MSVCDYPGNDLEIRSNFSNNKLDSWTAFVPSLIASKQKEIKAKESASNCFYENNTNF